MKIKIKPYILLILLSFLLLGVFFLLFHPDHRHGYQGRAETHSFFSQKVQDRYKIVVYLPKGYAIHPEMQYPVVYTLDGNYYGRTTAIIMNQYKRSGVVPRDVIVVGIGYHYETWYDKRYRDFIYTALINFETLSIISQIGGALDFYDFLTLELIPFIDSHYRTENTFQGRTLMGHAMGGYFTLLAMFRQMQTSRSLGLYFANFIAASPAMVNNLEYFFALEKYIFQNAYKIPQLPVRLFVGGSDIEEHTRTKYLPLLTRRLKTWRFPGFHLEYQTLEGISLYKTALPLFKEGLKYIFSNP